MAFDPAPGTDWWPTGYAYASDQITLNTAAHASPLLTELTAAEANATTGDIRDVYHALCAAMYAAWDGQDDADLPTKMVITRSESLNSDGSVKHTFAFSFDLAVTVGDVESE
tara:strand:+ start:314 stop:649 length:336 start_codon:yes stop_codon:yes gene_type:complete